MLVDYTNSVAARCMCESCNNKQQTETAGGVCGVARVWRQQKQNTVLATLDVSSRTRDMATPSSTRGKRHFLCILIGIL